MAIQKGFCRRPFKTQLSLVTGRASKQAVLSLGFSASVTSRFQDILYEMHPIPAVCLNEEPVSCWQTHTRGVEQWHPEKRHQTNMQSKKCPPYLQTTAYRAACTSGRAHCTTEA